jgi:hypothetical protein
MDMKKGKILSIQRDHLVSVDRSQIILQTHWIHPLNKSTIEAVEYHTIHTTDNKWMQLL